MRYPVWGVTRDQNGLVIASAAIDVYLAGSTTAAEVYLAQVGGVPVSTVTSGINSYFVFYVDAAKSAMQGYKLDIKKAGYSAYVIDNVFPAFTDYWVDARAISDNVYTSDDIVVTLEAIGTVNKSTILLKPGIWQLNDDLEIPANVKNNTIHLNRDQFTTYTADRPCVGVWQFHDATNAYATHFGSLIDCNISGNTIVQTDAPSADQTGNGMVFGTVDGLMVSNNTIRGVAATGVIFRGTPWGTKNVQFIGNSIHDFGSNTSAYAHHGMQLSFGMTFTAPPDAGVGRCRR